MKRLGILFLVGVGVLFLASVNGFAIGTTYQTHITNKAVVTGGNFNATSNTVVTQVMRIAGGHWTGENDAISGVSAGALVTNTTYLTNFGNDSFTFVFSVASNANDGGAGNHHPWAWRIYQNGTAVGGWHYGTAGSATLAAINSGARSIINFVVQVSNNAGGGYETYVLRVQDSGTHENTDNYAGDNGIQYGGPAGAGWGDTMSDALACYGAGDAAGDGAYRWRIQVSGPIINIIKRVSTIQVADAAGPDNVAVPGATITYSIVVSNSGGNATGPLVIKDVIATNNLSFVGGSMSVVHDDTVGGGSWTTNVSLPNIKWSNSNDLAGSGGWIGLQFQAIIK